MKIPGHTGMLCIVALLILTTISAAEGVLLQNGTPADTSNTSDNLVVHRSNQRDIAEITLIPLVNYQTGGYHGNQVRQAAGGTGADARSTTRVSVRSNGNQGNSYSRESSISGNTGFVAFGSNATNLVAGDTNGMRDIFVHEIGTGATTRVSVRSDGDQGDGASYSPSISRNGQIVAFDSVAANLVNGDTNHARDVYIHNRKTGVTRRISVSSTGGQANGFSYNPAISSNGRYVAFESYATNLVDADTNIKGDVFVHDRQTGATTRVSVRSNGNQGNGDSYSPSISADGRYVAFESAATNLVAGDTNGAWDVFVHDRQTGATTRVSVRSNGNQGNDDSYDPSISADGRFLAFYSGAANLVAGDTNGVYDVFVHDRDTGATKRISVRSNGNQGDSYSVRPAISSNGRYVAFDSGATNLVAGDTNEEYDVFLHDRQTAETMRVSVRSNGNQGNGYSYNPSISAAGGGVTFESDATNLVAGDTNGEYDIFVSSFVS
ncbi:MAG: hypothetical protein LUQ25_08090 [Methanoregulaceae archaeon]|nr:hypothetical protein [Methanoregulaceae archaeon]